MTSANTISHTASYSNCVNIISILRFQWNEETNIVETAPHYIISRPPRIR